MDENKREMTVRDIEDRDTYLQYQKQEYKKLMDADSNAYDDLKGLVSGIEDDKGKNEEDDEESERKIKEYLRDHNDGKEENEYLVRGAKLKCSCGSNNRKLNLNTCHGVYIKGHPVAHELDCIPGDRENITWFGVCDNDEIETEEVRVKLEDGGERQGKRCYPEIVGIWMDTYEGTKIVDNHDEGEVEENLIKCNALTVGSFLVCRHGGIIAPVNSGQDLEVTQDDFVLGEEAYRRVMYFKHREKTEDTDGESQELYDLPKYIADNDPNKRVKNKDYLIGKRKKLTDGTEDKESGENVEDAEFVGYLMYGAGGITQNEEEGFFKLYDSPTLHSEGDIYEFNDLYEKYDVSPYGSLQSFGGTAGLNKEGNIQYGGQDFDPSKGTLIYNGLERYAIAIGPVLQNPDCDINDFKNGIDANDMAYGTCVDISINLDGSIYYIPAIIVDTKAHSAPTGIFQTGVPFSDKSVSQDTGAEGPIVEWYVIEGKEDKDKTTGLNRFNRNSSIIIYREEVLY